MVDQEIDQEIDQEVDQDSFAAGAPQPPAEPMAARSPGHTPARQGPQDPTAVHPTPDRSKVTR